MMAVDPKDLLLGMVDAEMARRTVDKFPHRDYRVRIPLEAANLLVASAADREMSVSAYLRRAGLAFVALDQGIPLPVLLENEPRTRLRLASPKSDRSERGEGHGLWEIGSLL
jgi:hypothetical protein